MLQWLAKFLSIVNNFPYFHELRGEEMGISSGVQVWQMFTMSVNGILGSDRSCANWQDFNLFLNGNIDCQGCV